MNSPEMHSNAFAVLWVGVASASAPLLKFRWVKWDKHTAGKKLFLLADFLKTDNIFPVEDVKDQIK